MSYTILTSCSCNTDVLHEYTTTEDKRDDLQDSVSVKIERIFDQFVSIIRLGDFIAELVRKDTLILSNGNESILENNNINEVRLVHCATSKDLSTTRRSHMETFRN